MRQPFKQFAQVSWIKVLHRGCFRVRRFCPLGDLRLLPGLSASDPHFKT